MNKAFIFDMDGVLINSELGWEKFEKWYYPEQFGDKISKMIGSTIGMSIQQIYKKAISLGASIEKKQFEEEFFIAAPDIYKTAPISKNVNKLVKTLLVNSFRIGIVSQSPKEWIDILLKRLSIIENIEVIISINDRSDLLPKPSPSGYMEAIKQLGSTPDNTIILEDSNRGIQSAKAAGAYVIGFKENLLPGYKQEGADVYAENMDDVMKIVESLPVSSL